MHPAGAGGQPQEEELVETAFFFEKTLFFQ